MMFLPALAIALGLTGVARLGTPAFLSASWLLLVGLIVFAGLKPSLTMYYKGPLWASGYDTWVFPLAAAVILLVLAAWRRERNPGVGAALFCFVLSAVVLQFGRWIA